MILKLRDYANCVPRDFGAEIRKEILDTCLAVASVQKDGITPSAREATFVITDPSLDSYGEVIDAGAFDASLKRFMRNPVVLPEHRHRIDGTTDIAIVGHCTAVFKKGDALLATIRFSQRPFGDYRWQAVNEGDLRAVSVGFRPVNWDIIDKILHYKEALLKEVSTCPVGANDNALLVNLYVAGQLEAESAKTPEAGRVAELAAAVDELRAQLQELTGEKDSSRIEAIFGEQRQPPSADNESHAVREILQSLSTA